MTKSYRAICFTIAIVAVCLQANELFAQKGYKPPPPPPPPPRQPANDNRRPYGSSTSSSTSRSSSGSGNSGTYTAPRPRARVTTPSAGVRPANSNRPGAGIANDNRRGAGIANNNRNPGRRTNYVLPNQRARTNRIPVVFIQGQRHKLDEQSIRPVKRNLSAQRTAYRLKMDAEWKKRGGYPGNNGFAGKKNLVILPAGHIIDRRGWGCRFTSPSGESEATRALPATAKEAPKFNYVVVKSLPVFSGTARDYKDLKGGAHQYEHLMDMDELVEKGYVKKVPVSVTAKPVAPVARTPTANNNKPPAKK